MDNMLIGLKVASKYAGVSIPTMHDWCKKYNIADRSGSIWIVYKDRLQKIMEARKTLRSK